MRKHFDEHLAAMTGLEFIGHHNVGEVIPGMREDVVDRHALGVAGTARKIAHGGC